MGSVRVRYVALHPKKKNLTLLYVKPAWYAHYGERSRKTRGVSKKWAPIPVPLFLLQPRGGHLTPLSPLSRWIKNRGRRKAATRDRREGEEEKRGEGEGF